MSSKPSGGGLRLRDVRIGGMTGGVSGLSVKREKERIVVQRSKDCCFWEVESRSCFINRMVISGA